jgi:hypothetical protein
MNFFIMSTHNNILQLVIGGVATAVSLNGQPLQQHTSINGFENAKPVGSWTQATYWPNPGPHRSATQNASSSSCSNFSKHLFPYDKDSPQEYLLQTQYRNVD